MSQDNDDSSPLPLDEPRKAPIVHESFGSGTDRRIRTQERARLHDFLSTKSGLAKRMAMDGTERERPVEQQNEPTNKGGYYHPHFTIDRLRFVSMEGPRGIAFGCCGHCSDDRVLWALCSSGVCSY